MKREFPRARWSFAIIPLAAISLALSSGSSAFAPENTELGMRAEKCERWPFPVYCYEYAGQPSFNCFNTFCEATAAGWSRCTRNLKGTCD